MNRRDAESAEIFLMDTTYVKGQLNDRGNAGVAVLARALEMKRAKALDNWFIYLPAGEHTIEATVNGKAEQVVVVVDESAATVLQADLLARLATNVEPALDYNHEGGRASGWPKGFRWVSGVGVVCDIEWTVTAREAIRAGEWRYFSPEFRYDRRTRKVLGLRATGPLGGLVNDPAFRAMPAVQARQHNFPATEPELPQTKPQHTMEKNIVAALHAAGILSPTEAAGDNAPALVTARIAELRAGEPIKAAHAAAEKVKDEEIKALKAEIATGKEKAAADAVAEAVKAGRIAPKDEATQKFWAGCILQQGETAIKALHAQPVNPALKPTPTGSAEDAPETGKEAEAEGAAVSARAVAIAAERKIPFASAWPIAEAEIKGARA